VLQAVIDPQNFSVVQHFKAASALLDALGLAGRGRSRARQEV